MTDRTLFRRTLTGFIPFNDAGQVFFARCKAGDVVELKGVRVRNGGFHRLFFAMLGLIAENSDPSLTTDEVLHFAKLAAGCGKWIKDSRGEDHFIPGSISFAAMDQPAFEAFVQAAIPPLCKRFVHGISADAVIAEAMSLVGENA